MADQIPINEPISVDDLNLGNCFDILRKKECEDAVKCFEAKGKTPSEVLDMEIEEQRDLLGKCSDAIKRKAVQILKDFSEGLYTYKIVNDPIHGHFEIHPLCVKIIDTPQFQRLRNLKQMGAKYLVYPGASHNRFEHSLGVYYLAGEFASMLNKRQPDLNISENDILCVQIAGLCHDLGHGPYSHMFDNKFLPLARDSDEIKHEELSVKMFDHLVTSKKGLSSVFDKYGVGQTEREFIKDLIARPQQESGAKERRKGKEFLYEIVANKRNGIDVDKWDYLARDCHMLGIKSNFDHTRCMKYARVLEVKENGKKEHQICFRDKEVWNLYEMFHTRNTLHRIACEHRVGNIIEAMITEALLEADNLVLTPGKNGKKRKISETVDDMEAYQKLSDDIFQKILWSEEDNLSASKEILMKIEKRELYKCVGQIRIPYKKIKKDEFKNDFLSKKSHLKKEDIVIHSVVMDYGMKDKNPIENVLFYKKKDPTEPIPVQEIEVSHIQTKTFAEWLIECYCKERDRKGIKQLTQAFKEWAEDYKTQTTDDDNTNESADNAQLSTQQNLPMQFSSVCESQSHLSF